MVCHAGRMGFWGDPASLRRIARALDQRAVDVARQGARFGSAVDGLHWQSVAADKFRRGADHDHARIATVAAELHEASAAMYAHASTVELRLAEIAAIEHAVERFFVSVTSTLRHAASDIVHAFTHPIQTIEHTIEHPPWESWPWQPHNLPPIGDPRWFEVRSDLERRGVHV